MFAVQIIYKKIHKRVRNINYDGMFCSEVDFRKTAYAVRGLEKTTRTDKGESVAIGLKFFTCFSDLSNLNSVVNASFCERGKNFFFAFSSSEVLTILCVASR